MANQACFAIGINRYEFFPPLDYAQADAQALWQFLVGQAGWSQDLCLLLTETSPLVQNRSTYPTRENIMAWVDDFVESPVLSGDVFWFFMSGYGVTKEGEDYLMPIDGKPDDISTGISVRWLFERLKQRGDAPILVLLDINRSQYSEASVGVGHQTVELAEKLLIPTLLSGQLDEFSYESASLGHGLFTAALLEALRYDPGMTLANLDRYLRARVLELSKHHSPPVLQTPLSVIPFPEAGNQLILPSEHTDVRLNPPSVTPVATGAEVGSGQGGLVPQPNGNSTAAQDDTPGWQNLLFWGTGVALVVLMIVGVFLRNREAFSSQQAETPTNATGIKPGTSSQDLSSRTGGFSQNVIGNPRVSDDPASTTQKPKLSSPPKSQQQGSQAVLDKARTLIVPNQASQFSQAIAQASKIPQGDPLYDQAQQDIARWSEVIMDLAKGRAQQGDFQAAIAAAQLVPPDQSVSAEAERAIAGWKEKANQQQKNKILLQGAKALIRPTQASSYNKAITAASQVPPGQPGYAQAQKLIADWSRTIYQIAQSRAAKGKFQEAIQTAVLVPANTPAYEAAQKAIATWKKK